MPIISSDDSAYKLRQAEFTKRAWLRGIYDSIKVPDETRICKNNTCSKYFKVKPHDKKVYCGSRCAAIVNNSNRPKILYFCIVCQMQLKRRSARYCSNKCQNTQIYNLYIDRWKKCLEGGGKSINTRFLSGHIERYLKEKYKDKCSICKWNKRNPVTGVVPLEIDHIDGNSENNVESNLRLICPNCHSLTPYFRNLNKGRGRVWRLNYIKANRVFEN